MTRPTKHPKTGVYRIRMAVPAPLRAIVGKRELVESLETRDDAEARKRAPAVVEKFTAAIAAARGDARVLTLAEIDGLCGEWFRQQMAQHGDEPGDPMDWDMLVSDQTDKWDDDDNRELVEPTADAQDHADAAALLAAAGIRADDHSDARLAARLVRTKFKFGQEMLRRLTSAAWSPAPASFPPPPVAAPARATSAGAAAAAVPFAALLDGYVLENQRNARARYDRERTLERLKAFLGHADAARVSADERAARCVWCPRWRAVVVVGSLTTVAAVTAFRGRSAPYGVAAVVPCPGPVRNASGESCGLAGALLAPSWLSSGALRPPGP